jgi:carotenoid 1,2-hydratase
MDGIFSTAGGKNGNTGPLPGGGQRAPGAGRADGGPLRASRGGKPDGVEGFDAAVPSGGYRWWYLDGLSDDGRHGLTIIGFVGSVFSPYYALARRKGGADPENFCALNVALYGEGGHRWSMTERGRRFISRDARRASPSGPVRCAGRTVRSSSTSTR